MDVRPPRGIHQRLSGARPLTFRPSLRSTPTARFLALRATNVSNIGAHSVAYVPLVKGVGSW